MTPLSQLIFVCEKLLGWKNCRFDGELPCGNAPDAFGSWRQLPPLTLDLVHECALALKSGKLLNEPMYYSSYLDGLKDNYGDYAIDATAEQRMSAIIETIKGTQ